MPLVRTTLTAGRRIGGIVFPLLTGIVVGVRTKGHHAPRPRLALALYLVTRWWGRGEAERLHRHAARDLHRRVDDLGRLLALVDVVLDCRLGDGSALVRAEAGLVAILAVVGLDAVDGRGGRLGSDYVARAAGRLRGPSFRRGTGWPEGISFS